MNKTVLVSIDGLRSDAVGIANTPVLDYLIENGSFNFKVKSVSPSITLPSHFSIFTSLAPYSHGVLTNTAQPDISSLPQSLFFHIKQHSGTVSLFYSWEHLRNLALPGNIDFSYMQRLYEEKDLITLTRSATEHIIDHCPDFCFIYLEWLDVIGHQSGWMSDQYIQALEHIDKALELVLDSISSFTQDQGYHLVIVSDHGGKGDHHLEPCPEVMTVPFIAFGRAVRENYQIKSDMTLLDVAPTISELFGIPLHFAWEGKPVSEILKNKNLNKSFIKVA